MKLKKYRVVTERSKFNTKCIFLRVQKRTLFFFWRNTDEKFRIADRNKATKFVDLLNKYS